MGMAGKSAGARCGDRRQDHDFDLTRKLVAALRVSEAQVHHMIAGLEIDRVEVDRNLAEDDRRAEIDRRIAAIRHDCRRHLPRRIERDRHAVSLCRREQ